MVLDVYSRKVVGWAFGERMTADLVVEALNMALHTRKPGSVIHHSDQGSQHTSLAFGQRCHEMGVRPSMGSVGDAYDNSNSQYECTKQPPAEAGGFELRTGSPDTRRLNDASEHYSIRKSSFASGSK